MSLYRRELHIQRTMLTHIIVMIIFTVGAVSMMFIEPIATLPLGVAVFLIALLYRQWAVLLREVRAEIAEQRKMTLAETKLYFGGLVSRDVQ